MSAIHPFHHVLAAIARRAWPELPGARGALVWRRARPSGAAARADGGARRRRCAEPAVSGRVVSAPAETARAASAPTAIAPAARLTVAADAAELG
ncbi:hypothetical protein FE772_17320 [Lysobacter enzymogenes]|nr:hypothetical protein [Lysobacter enzymogenes]QCW27135.1 hypothetical protein FE772_17320 [Lysobacter enzymogenes]